MGWSGRWKVEIPWKILYLCFVLNLHEYWEHSVMGRFWTIKITAQKYWLKHRREPYGEAICGSKIGQGSRTRKNLNNCLTTLGLTAVLPLSLTLGVWLSFRMPNLHLINNKNECVLPAYNILYSVYTISHVSRSFNKRWQKTKKRCLTNRHTCKTGIAGNINVCGIKFIKGIARVWVQNTQESLFSWCHPP